MKTKELATAQPYHPTRLHYGLTMMGLKLAGWRIEGEKPTAPRFVLIFAPHTSNWDFLLANSVACYFNVPSIWLAKTSMFKGPKGRILLSIGGVPIERDQATGLVEDAILAFEHNSVMALLLTPEGTRRKTDRWKSGFYRIALGANIPIVMGYFDYPHKVAGIGGTLMPTGDMQSDMEIIRAFYQSKTAKFPHNASDIRLEAEDGA